MTRDLIETAPAVADTRPTVTNPPEIVPAHTPREAAPRPLARPRVVVVGAGFGGLSVARSLAEQDIDVLLLDRNNYHGFWPLLYQVATAGLEPEAIAHPVRGIVRNYRNVDFQMVEVTGVDFRHREVQTNSGPVAYDYLVLAAGSANNYFGNDALAEQTFGMKDIDEAEQLRNHALRMFERAALEQDFDARAALLTFVIIGGGPTGVELAGAFAELIGHVLRKDYPMLDVRQARVVLVEAGPTVLATFPAQLQRTAQKRLEQMGVELMPGRAVATVEQGVVSFKDGGSLQAGTVIWSAGVRASKLADTLNVALARGARVKISQTLNLAEHPEVFVIGDMAYLEGFNGQNPYPMVAPVAIQMGQQTAKNILAQVHGRSMKPFRYFDKGQMATIGRKAAVLDSFGIRLSGLLAWVGWLFIHLLELIGFRNRLVVLANWVYNYVTYDRGVRLITRRDRSSIERVEDSLAQIKR